MSGDIVVDVETVGPEWADLDPPTREYLCERARRALQREGIDAEAAGLLAEPRAADRLALELGLAQVVAIGMWSVDRDRGLVLVNGEPPPDIAPWPFDDTKVVFASEAAILKQMWDIFHQTRQLRVITFNGRSYDGPVLMIRSAQLGVPCSMDLVPYRYSIGRHCDMADVLSFFGGVNGGGYGVDYWCRRFDIESPKEEGITGADVGRLYREGNFAEIARYARRDVRGEAALYRKLAASWLPLLRDGPQWPPVPVKETEGDLRLGPEQPDGAVAA